MSLAKATIKTILDPKDPRIVLGFNSQRELRAAYSELELCIAGRVILQPGVRDAHAYMHLCAVINSLASDLKSGAVWSERHERLMEGL